MGISTSSQLLVGAWYCDLSDWVDKNTSEDWYAEDIIEEHFQQISPWYGSTIEERFIGLEIPNDAICNDLWISIVKRQCDKFEKITGVKASIHGGADVW